MLKVVVADDHPITRSGTKYLLRDHFSQIQIYEAENGSQVIEHVKKQSIDVVLMDLNMPDTDSQGTLQTLLVLSPDTNVLILSMNKEEIFGPLYLKMGARGYISKVLGEQEIPKAIKAVLEGNIYIRREMKEFYEKGQKVENPYQSLTRKEMEVLRHLVKGAPVAAISNAMSITITTVSTHKANIFNKLQLNNLLELKSLIDLYPL